jgi:hypothetical protein
MERTLVCLLCSALLVSGLAVSAASADKQKAAVTAAETWLEKVDAGQYAESWKEAAELFRKAVTQAQWDQALQAARKPLGKCLSRKMKNCAYETSLPGAPDGEYVVIQFDASFENKKAAVETVTPKLEKDGTWRVSGYFIR